MCRSLAQGGQRCAAHTRPAYLRARFGTPQWAGAAARFASTPTGRQELVAELAGAECGGDVERAVALRQALRQGEAMREVASVARDVCRTRSGVAPAAAGSDDAAWFEQDAQAALTRAAAGEPAIGYMNVNALDGMGDRGTGRGFGVELEFDFPRGLTFAEQRAARAAIGRELHALGLLPTERQDGDWRSTDSDQHHHGWKFCTDGSVNGGEIVSPIMYDEPETWTNLAAVCEVITRHGGVASVRTGSHVHVSTGDYGHEVGNHNRLLNLFNDNQEAIYRLATDPVRGSHRNAHGSDAAIPNTAVPPGGYTSVADVRVRNGSKQVGLNFGYVGGTAEDHVEFRIWDGTLDPAVIQTQIKVSVAMAEAARRDIDHAGSGGQAGAGSTRRFVEGLFRRREDRAQVAALVAVTGTASATSPIQG